MGASAALAVLLALPLTAHAAVAPSAAKGPLAAAAGQSGITLAKKVVQKKVVTRSAVVKRPVVVHKRFVVKRPLVVQKRTVVKAPVVTRKVVVRKAPRYVVVRPWYTRPHYGTLVAGVALGTILAVTATGVVPYAPSDNLCWYWTSPYKTNGYWDYCD